MDTYTASSEALTEALALSEDILSDIELGTSSLSNVALKASRLARLIGDFELQQVFLYEVGGYPTTPSGVSSEVWGYAKKAGRIRLEKVGEETKELASLESLEQLVFDLEAAKDNLASARDADVSVTSANPSQFVHAPSGNTLERRQLRNTISEKSKVIAQRRAYIYDKVSTIHYELKYSSISSDIFARTRDAVDSKIGSIVPNAVKKFSAVYDNLISDNPEDWSNAVHSCRRILQDTADALYPATEDKTISVNGKDKIIKLGKDNYINRLLAYAEEHSSSDRFNEIVGSHIKYLGERLDSIFKAAQKGSHDVISSQQEADRYVIYTYLIVGDLLQLYSEVQQSQQQV